QAEDGIRYPLVTGVQTCALPISHHSRDPFVIHVHPTLPKLHCDAAIAVTQPMLQGNLLNGRSYRHALLDRRSGLKIPVKSRSARSEERRVGKACRSGEWCAMEEI